MKQTVASSSCTACTDHHRSIYNSKTFSKPMPFKNAEGRSLTNTLIKSIHKPPLPKLSEQPTAPDSLAPFCTTPCTCFCMRQYSMHSICIEQNMAFASLDSSCCVHIRIPNNMDHYAWRPSHRFVGVAFREPWHSAKNSQRELNYSKLNSLQQVHFNLAKRCGCTFGEFRHHSQEKNNACCEASIYARI